MTMPLRPAIWKSAGLALLADRWSVVAYVEALQASQHAPSKRLPADLQLALEGRP